MKINFLNEEHTVESVKEDLPKVKVMFDGEECTGYIRTGKTEFAYVRLKEYPGTKFKFDWETVVNSLNNNTPLEA